MRSSRLSTKFLSIVPTLCAFCATLILFMGVLAMPVLRQHASALTVLPLCLLEVALVTVSALSVVALVLKRSRETPPS